MSHDSATHHCSEKDLREGTEWMTGKDISIAEEKLHQFDTIEEAFSWKKTTVEHLSSSSQERLCQLMLMQNPVGGVCIPPAN